jgi:anti-sigma B factor antagonist
MQPFSGVPGGWRPQRPALMIAVETVNDQISSFEATLRREGPTVILSLSGELVLSSIGDFRAALEDTGTEPLELLVIDLRQLEFLDSSGLRAIVASEGYALGRGYALQIVKGNEQVHEVFQVTGLDTKLPIVDALPLNGTA